MKGDKLGGLNDPNRTQTPYLNYYTAKKGLITKFPDNHP